MALIRLPWTDEGDAPIARPIGEQTPSQFTAITPILATRRDDLTAVFDKLRQRSLSPFADVPGVHMARFEIIDSIPAGGLRPVTRACDPAGLLFGVSHDGTLRELVARMGRTMADSCDQVWECCAEYPGSANVDLLVGWLRRHSVAAQLAFRTHDASREQIETALDRRRRLRAFAARSVSLDPAALQAAFKAEFGTPQTPVVGASSRRARS